MAFERELVVEWGECDAAGMVFHAHYYRWFDTTFHHLTDAAGFPPRVLQERFGAFGTPLVEVGASHAAPAAFADRLTVSAEVSRWGRSTMSLRYGVRRGAALLAAGRETRVLVSRDADSGRMQSMVLPAAFREAVAALTGGV